MMKECVYNEGGTYILLVFTHLIVVGSVISPALITISGKAGLPSVAL